MTVFALPPGVDFGAEVIAGLDTRHPDPTDLARVTLIVNTRRLERRLTDLYRAGKPRLLPRIEIITSLTPPPGVAPSAPATSPLRRRLEVVDLVSKLLDSDPTLAPRASLYDLADSLIGLMDEIQGEGQSVSDITSLDISDQSGHWARAQRFFAIAAQYLASSATRDPETRMAQDIDAAIAHWADHPPRDPIYVAGSTGSRGTTHRLMLALAQLKGCGVIVPGFDFDLPASVWSGLGNALTSEDHPQYRFFKLLDGLGLPPDAVERWTGAAIPNPERAKLLSLALRPAPVTDQWRRDGPRLTALGAALDGVTVLDAPTQRDEAQTIALRLRKAAEEGQTAALVTPDRMLTRRVAAALDRWGIVPDDSAGTPLHLSPPGRFLRHTAELPRQPLTVETLLTLLKHPLTHSGQDRNQHQLNTRDLELMLRRKEVVYPQPDTVRAFADASGRSGWGDWLADCVLAPVEHDPRRLADWVAAHRAWAETIAAGSSATGSGALWDAAAGRAARDVFDMLEAEAPIGGILSASDYADLVRALLARAEVRDRDAPYPGILIWGTLEARVQSADMVILGGLNDGVWPQAPQPDPWLNRTLRHRAGLLMPDRQIGLAAHDFQIAAAAKEIWLTRSVKSDDADTVPSRWINRLSNLLHGLVDQGGPVAWAKAKARGDNWLAQAARLDQAERVAPAPRPSPCPLVHARPVRLNVTDIARLRRDPYAIYARDILRLRALNPVMRTPDARLRGILLHQGIERFVRDGDSLSTSALLAALDRELDANVPWHTVRALWRARMARSADRFVEAEAMRQAIATPEAFETSGEIALKSPPLTLRGRADRVDVTDDGQALIYDYKTGTPPNAKQQLAFDRQLLIIAAMLARGAFADVGATDVAVAAYLGLGTGAPVVPAPLGDGPKEETIETVWAKLGQFLTEVYDPDHGFTSRRAVFETRFEGEYDHLARFGEWDHTSPALLMRLS